MDSVQEQTSTSFKLEMNFGIKDNAEDFTSFIWKYASKKLNFSNEIPSQSVHKI